MNEPELNQFEQDLRELRPASPPPELMARLMSTRPRQEPVATRSTSTSMGPRRSARLITFSWRAVLRWLVPVTALGMGLALVWVHPAGVATAPPILKADSVKVDEELVNSFDAVGRLPSGEPVRFRYQQWMDQLVVRDDDRGVVIEQRTPRVEVIPVRFETY